jgi:hypothetical protein
MLLTGIYIKGGPYRLHQYKNEELYASVSKHLPLSQKFKSRIWLPFPVLRLLAQFNGRNSSNEVDGKCLQQQR